jgi:hypothetical protein
MVAKEVRAGFSFLKMDDSGVGMVAHAYNPIYWGCGVRKIMV